MTYRQLINYIDEYCKEIHEEEELNLSDFELGLAKGSLMVLDNIRDYILAGGEGDGLE